MKQSAEYGGVRGYNESSEREKLLQLLKENPELLQQINKEVESAKQDKSNNDRLARDQEKAESRNRILQDLDPDLKIDEDKSYGGRDGEHVTILLKGGVLGEIVSDNHLTGMDNREFQDKVFNLYKRFKELEKGKERTSIFIDSNAKKVMDKFRISVSGFELSLAGTNIDLYSDGENENIKFEKINDDSILLTLEEYGGRVVSYEIVKGELLPDSRRVTMKK